VDVGSLDLEKFFSELHLLTATKSHTHQLHPYPAKFIPQIPRVLIESFSEPGDVVLDPMCGSGTTAVEAIALGRRAVATDINPVSCLVTRAKTTFIEPEAHAMLSEFAIDVREGRLAAGGLIPEFHNREHWFAPEVQDELAAIKQGLLGLRDASARDLAKASLSAIIVGVSRQDSETRWVRVDRGVSGLEVRERYARHLLGALVANASLGLGAGMGAQVFQADARSLPLDRASIDLIVTSPPYANSHDYYLYNKLRMFWLDFDVKSTQSLEFGSRNKHSDQRLGIEHYIESMRGVFVEFSRVLRPGGRACVVVGDAVIRGEFFDMGALLPSVAEYAGLRLETDFQFGQQQFTRAFIRGFGTKLAKKTHVLILARP
jgi:site-specific DNA-methyltransferase (cytosine-N4-specific)